MKIYKIEVETTGVPYCRRIDQTFYTSREKAVDTIKNTVCKKWKKCQYDSRFHQFFMFNCRIPEGYLVASIEEVTVQ
ncbi:MAG: hypothetical protein ACOC22_03520 [bacterium]